MVGVDGSNLQRDLQLNLVGLHLAMNQMNYRNGRDHYDEQHTHWQWHLVLVFTYLYYK